MLIDVITLSDSLFSTRLSFNGDFDEVKSIKEMLAL